jgi:hypothetical protein
MPVSLGRILETRDCVIGDRHAKRKCNSSELVRLLHGQISSGDQEEICAAASLFGSLVLECSSSVLDADQLRVFELLAECVMNSSSAAVACACLRAMSNCFATGKQPPQLTQQLCSRILLFILNPVKEFHILSQPGTVVDSLGELLHEDVQVCACRLLSSSGTFLQFCSQQDSKAPLLKPSFKAALTSGPSFDAQIYTENCMKVAHLAFAPRTAVRLTAVILDALASSPRPLFIFGLLQLKQQQCTDLLHAGHPSVRAALSRLLIVTLSSPAAPSIVLNGLSPADASRTLCRLLATNETAKHAVVVIASLLNQRPSQHLLNFFLSQRLVHALCKLMATQNLTSSLLEILFTCLAKLTSSFDEARRVVVDFCEEQEDKPGWLISVAFGHINSSASCLRHASASFVLSMSRSAIAIRSIFVDASVAPMLLSLLSSPYFDAAIQPELMGEVGSNTKHSSAEIHSSSYSATVMAIISNCLLPLSLFRDELIVSDNFVSLVCRCAMESIDPELRTNSLCAISSITASQPSQELKLRIMVQLDVKRFLHTLQTGSARHQELCLLILRNCADGPAEDVGALLMMLRLYDAPAAQCISYFSEFCLGPGSAGTSSCVHACSASFSAPLPDIGQPRTSVNKLKSCIFHDCPVDELDGRSLTCLENCARIRNCLASIVSFSQTSSPSSIEHLFLLLANIASGSPGRKALILDAVQPSTIAEALASGEDSVRRVSFFCPSVSLRH